MFSLLKVQSQYNAYRAGITSAIVLAIMVPVGIALYCLLIFLRQKGAQRGMEKGYGGGGGANYYQPSGAATVQPNIRSSESSGSKVRNGTSDRDSGIQANDNTVKMHDDGRVTLERDRLYQKAGNVQPKRVSDDNESVDSGLQTLKHQQACFFSDGEHN